MNIPNEQNPQTIAIAFQDICRGEEPWNALGNFMNAFFGYARDRREYLMTDPVCLPVKVTGRQRNWAAFCAASAEYLSQLYRLPCPLWAYDPCFYLARAWYSYPNASRYALIRARLRERTPAPFRQRRIFCGDRLFLNKYEDLPLFS